MQGEMEWLSEPLHTCVLCGCLPGADVIKVRVREHEDWEHAAGTVGLSNS